MTVNCEFVLHSDCMHKTIRETTKIKKKRYIHIYVYLGIYKAYL